jgi:hypothetical protein
MFLENKVWESVSLHAALGLEMIRQRHRRSSAFFPLSWWADLSKPVYRWDRSIIGSNTIMPINHGMALTYRLVRFIRGAAKLYLTEPLSGILTKDPSLLMPCGDANCMLALCGTYGRRCKGHYLLSVSKTGRVLLIYHSNAQIH